MVLAAGQGTRLRPLTDERPKPLCPVGDRAAIDAVLDALAAAGIERAVVNAFHLADAYDQAFVARQRLEVVVVRERALLGTAGGVANAARLLGDSDVLCLNADVLAEVDFEGLCDAHTRRASAVTLGATRCPLGEGTLGLGAEGQVVRLRDGRFGQEVASANYAGVAVLSAGFRARLPTPGCLVADGLLPLLAAQQTVHVALAVRGFCDVGRLEDYLAANLAWLEARGRSSFVGARAVLADAVQLDRALVGDDAVVEGEGTLRRVVVWPGARARAPLESAIVTPSGVVAVPAAG